MPDQKPMAGAKARRSYGTGSLLTVNGAYYGKWRDPSGRQVKRRIGRPHEPDGITRSQAESRLRDLIQTTSAAASLEHARTL